MSTSQLSAQTAQPSNPTAETTVTVRYIVKDVSESVEFYTKHLGFTIAMDARPAFAMVARGPLRLALSGVAGPGGGSRPMPDGRKPEPGGWNRIQIAVGDLAARGGSSARRGCTLSQRHREGERRVRRSSSRTLRGIPLSSFSRIEMAAQVAFPLAASGVFALSPGRVGAIVAGVTGLIGVIVAGGLWPAAPVVAGHATGEAGHSGLDTGADRPGPRRAGRRHS